MCFDLFASNAPIIPRFIDLQPGHQVQQSEFGYCSIILATEGRAGILT
jgi:hypothetical protein